MNMELNENQKDELIREWAKEVVKQLDQLKKTSEMLVGSCELFVLPLTGLSIYDDMYMRAVDVNNVFRLGKALDLPVRVTDYAVDEVKVCVLTYHDYLFRTVLDESDYNDIEKYGCSIENLFYWHGEKRKGESRHEEDE